MSHTPVVLVPGWSDRARALRPLERHLIRAGWAPDQVHSIEFRDRYGSNLEHAAEIAQAIVGLAVHGYSQVDIVAHSMGGLAVRYLLQHGPHADRVRRVVFLGTPHRGTLAAYVAWGAGAAEMRLRSGFLQGLEDATQHAAELISIHTPMDLRLFPGSSAVLPGGRNLRVWCLGHRALLRSRRVHQLVQTLLEDP